MKPIVHIVDKRMYYKKEGRTNYKHYLSYLKIAEVEDIKTDKYYISINIMFNYGEETYKDFVKRSESMKAMYYDLKRVLFSNLLNDYFQESTIKDYRGSMGNYNNRPLSYGRHGGVREFNSFIEFRLEKKKMCCGYDRLTDDQFNWLWLNIYEYVIRYKQEHR